VTLLLDTADLPPETRTEAFRAAMGQATVPCRVEHLAPPDQIRARMHLWAYGRTSLFTNDASGYRLVRTARHLQMEAPPVVALAVQSQGHGRFSQLGHDQVVGPRDLMLNDLTAPYSFSWTGAGGSRAVQISYDHLGLPVDVVRSALGRLPTSPLHGLVHAHLHTLVAHAAELAGSPGVTAVGTATIELVRALVASAAHDDRFIPSVREETLVVRVQTYVTQHLDDTELTPAAIAGIHNVSVRQLYTSFAAAGLSLEQWVIEQRLETARSQLNSPTGRRRSIAATSRICGFQDPSHFTRRFRAAYGMTPREWQKLSD
jgi:AraC-like DNA-binding protein